MQYGRQQPKEKNFNLWAVLAFSALFITILIAIFISSMGNKKVTRLQHNQELILQFLEKSTDDNSRGNATPLNTPSTLLNNNSGVSQREFDNFKQQYQKDLQKLKLEIKRLKSLM